MKKNMGLIVLVVILSLLVGGLGGFIIYDKVLNTDADSEITNNDNNDQEEILSTICIADARDKLEILSMENKTERIRAIGSSTMGYNVTTTVTKEHNYTSIPEDEELYANDMLGTLYVLYKNKIYYTNDEKNISKYCEINEVNYSKKLICDYSKINATTIIDFNIINIDIELKAIGSYGNSGSGTPLLYAITTKGEVINIPNVLSPSNYNDCGILYQNPDYPVDRIFEMYFYDGIEYTILLKNGTLIIRDVDREHPIELGY